MLGLFVKFVQFIYSLHVSLPTFVTGNLLKCFLREEVKITVKKAQILTKLMLLWKDFFSNFQWIHWSEMTVPYLYLVVCGVTDWAFSISGRNCSHTVVLCHFPCFLAQLSHGVTPPAIFMEIMQNCFRVYQLSQTCPQEAFEMRKQNFCIYIKNYHVQGVFRCASISWTHIGE